MRTDNLDRSATSARYPGRAVGLGTGRLGRQTLVRHKVSAQLLGANSVTVTLCWRTAFAGCGTSHGGENRDFL